MVYTIANGGTARQWFSHAHHGGLCEFGIQTVYRHPIGTKTRRTTSDRSSKLEQLREELAAWRQQVGDLEIAGQGHQNAEKKAVPGAS